MFYPQVSVCKDPKIAEILPPFQKFIAEKHKFESGPKLYQNKKMKFSKLFGLHSRSSSNSLTENSTKTGESNRKGKKMKLVLMRS